VQLLNLALTRKTKKSQVLNEMCGFPVGSVDSFVEKLVGQSAFVAFIPWGVRPRSRLSVLLTSR
jgi:DNA mismatch repair ATPase MutS